MDNIFFKVWRNIFLKNKILKEIQNFKLFFHNNYYHLYKYQNYKLFKYNYYIINLILKDIPKIPSSLNQTLDESIKISGQVEHLILKKFKQKININLDFFITPNTKHLVLVEYNESLLTNDCGDGNRYKSIIPEFIENLELNQYDKPIENESLPKQLKILKTIKFNQKIFKDNLPESLTSLDLGDSFNKEISPNTLPNSITELKFGFQFNSKILPNSLPKNLKKLVFGYSFNQIIEKDILPNTLLILELGKNFNQSINGEDIIPNSITQLSLGDFHRASLSNFTLPKNLKTLKHFGRIESEVFKSNWLTNQCKSIENIFIYIILGNIEPNSIPNTVKNLELKTSFNQIIDENIFPDSITNLSLPYFFKSEIKVLPKSLEKFKMHGLYNIEFKLDLFQKLNSLTHLDFYELNRFPQKITSGLFPESVKFLSISQLLYPIEPNSLPSNLKGLKIKNYDKNFEIHLPISIESLLFDGIFYSNNFINLTSLINLKKLIIENSSNQNSNLNYNIIEPYSLPNNIIHFKLPLLKQTIDSTILPQNVKELEIVYPNGRYSIENNSIPSTCTKLLIIYPTDSIYKQMNKSFIFNNQMIPPNLMYLNFKNFNQPINENTFLPNNSIISIGFGSNLKYPLLNQYLPKSVLNIKIGSYDKQLIDKEIFKDKLFILKKNYIFD